MTSHKAGRPDLSVIVPVFNAADTIEKLVEDFLKIDALDCQILLVDDCSSDDSAAVVKRLAGAHSSVEALFHQQNAGAGIARNTAIPHATGEFTLFFDADDIVHGDAVVDCINNLRATDADLAMTPYFYLRDTSSSHDAMNLHDAQIWNEVTNGQNMQITSLDQAATLLGFSNYPWNKILRTDHYRNTGLKFGSTTVNNDILGHWYSLLFSRQILLLNHELCTHIVNSDGANLTNQHSRVRMQLFEALDETYDLLELDPDRRLRFAHHFWSLAVRTMRWARGRISEDMKTEYDNRFKDLLMRMDLQDYAKMRMKRAPGLSDDILRLVLN